MPEKLFYVHNNLTRDSIFIQLILKGRTLKLYDIKKYIGLVLNKSCHQSIETGVLEKGPTASLFSFLEKRCLPINSSRKRVFFFLFCFFFVLLLLGNSSSLKKGFVTNYAHNFIVF